jgi:aryl-alcohol dehydrogenase
MMSKLSYKIQAAVFRANGAPLKIESLEIEGLRDDEVLVRIVSSGICGTDIDFIDDWDGDPVVLGHAGRDLPLSCAHRERVPGPIRYCLHRR